MKITFLGGADEVGASSILVEIAGRRLLVDAGVRPSPKARWGLAGDQLPNLSQVDQAGGLDAILVTHAHTDHTGALELVVERYPEVPVYATPATIALTRVLHADSRRIMQSRLDEEGELPLFDDLAVERLLSAFEPLPFHTRLPLSEGLAVTFFPAGHIAGAAMLAIESDEGRLLISGDLAISPQRTVDGARLPAFEPDVLIVESTYGGRLHANRAVQERKLVEAVAQTLAGDGKVLIPAFALGRAQEVLLILREFQRRGELPAAPVWADGMVRAICQAYSGFADVLPLALQETGAQFFGGNIQPVQHNQQRNALVWEAGPAVIVASSGMLAGGPSLSYARALAGQPQHAVLLTGYQDEEAPGRRLQEVAERGRGTIRLGKDLVDVQCRLGTYSLSAHADEAQLISLVETLNPGNVLLVHGDEAARASLGKALQARQRSVQLPSAGQSFSFRFEIRRPGKAKSAAATRPLDLPALWREVTTGAGGYFHRNELAEAWWGEASAAQCETLNAALAGDDLYFAPDARRPDIYRARPPAQVETMLQRRARMAELAGLPGQWVTLRAGNERRLARCTGIANEYFWIENDEGEAERAWPEDLLQAWGEHPPETVTLVAPHAPIEPNQALSIANQRFPPEARLRRTGYRLNDYQLLLTFDFPDVAQTRYAAEIAALQSATGWDVALAPEANQSALFAMVGEVLPQRWRVAKGPALHRMERRVTATVHAPGPDSALERAVCQRYLEETGFELALTVVAAPSFSQAAPPAALPEAAEPLEINAAYAAIKAALDGSTLYRTSLKGGEIVLSFISPQVGVRYQAQIDQLSRQVGWPLAISSQPNQNAILDCARRILQAAGQQIAKGPSIYLERAVVAVTLPASPDNDALAAIGEQFTAESGYTLAVNVPPSGAPAAQAPAPQAVENVVAIPLGLIRLSRHQQTLAIDPLKLEKAAERARRLGQIRPPVQVRRLRDDYLLLDGLYRLEAARRLGWEKIDALVE
ncbi:MAG: MBL fold metallo-hydrolase [Chloroflexota bacterium]